jgi:hypothetical protein
LSVLSLGLQERYTLTIGRAQRRPSPGLQVAVAFSPLADELADR